MGRGEPRAALPSHGVQLVDEDDAGGMGFALLEQVAHAGGADPDEELDKVGPRYRVERHLRLTGDGARQERFSGSRRADQEDALG